MPPPPLTHTENPDKKLDIVEAPTVDRALAEHLMKGKPSSEAALTFLTHLSIASRQGHLCVTEEAPRPEELWPAVVESDQDYGQIAALVKQGARELPEGLPVVVDEGRYYFERYWESETALLRHIHRILESKPDQPLSAIETEGLLPEQAQAVENCGKRMLSIICGGPGTGKTYTVSAFLNQLPEDVKIALAAPTGKAASNLQANVKRPNTQAMTLHALLGMTKGRHETRKIPADVVIVDECSMIDARLMQNLFASVKSGCRLILLGDPHQLPPIDAGSLFTDIIEALPETTTYLKTCLRAESSEIIACAEAINRGESDLDFKELDDFAYPEIPECSADTIGAFRILSPLKRGRYGVMRINQYYLNRAKEQMQGNGPHVFPILITGNDYRMELFNGELGVLVRHGPIRDFQPRKGDYALFGERRIPALLLPSYDYAYCLSVHKSQGSEFETVVLLLPPGSERFGRKALYTGATRAKKKLEIWSSKDVIDQTVKSNPRRMSGLTFRLSSAI